MLLSLFGLEFLAAGASEHCTASLHHAANIPRSQGDKASIDQTFISALNPKDIPSFGDSSSNNCPYGCIHTRGITTTR